MASYTLNLSGNCVTAGRGSLTLTITRGPFVFDLKGEAGKDPRPWKMLAGPASLLTPALTWSLELKRSIA